MILILKLIIILVTIIAIIKNNKKLYLNLKLKFLLNWKNLI